MSIQLSRSLHPSSYLLRANGYSWAKLRRLVTLTALWPADDRSVVSDDEWIRMSSALYPRAAEVLPFRFLLLARIRSDVLDEAEGNTFGWVSWFSPLCVPRKGRRQLWKSWDIMLSEADQTEKDKYCMTSYWWYLLNKTQTNKYIEIESRIVLPGTVMWGK